MGDFFSDQFIDQVRTSSDVVEIIGSYVPLKRAGGNFVALCPFHREKSPSFNVNAQKQIFHCFGCHKGGDVFRFVQEYEHITFPEAVRRLAERARIPLETQNRSAGDDQRGFIKEQLLQVHEQIAQRWQAALQNDAAGQIARDYLEKRGVTPEAVKLFRLGFAPEAWDDTVNWGKSKNHELSLLQQAGLIVQKEGTDRFFDRFRGRLMFPICDEQSRVIGFSGRILSGDEKTAKYVNSPETPIFTKGRVFFGLDKSKRALLDAKTAIVCEGQLDLIACFMTGVQNMVAPQGTALTSDHARILKRYVEEVILCFDSDTAGQNATIRSFDSLLQAGLAVRVVTIPKPHDPDSLIRAKGADAFRALLEKAEGFFDYYLDQLCRANDSTTDKGRLAVMRSMAEQLQKANSAVLLDKYSQKTAIRLGVSIESVRADFKKSNAPLRTERPRDEGELPPSEEPLPRPSPQEFWLLRLMLTGDETGVWLAAFLDPEWIQHEGIRSVLKRRIELHQAEQWRGVADLLSRTDDARVASLLTEAAAEDRAIPDPMRQLQDLVLRLRNEALMRKMENLDRELASPDADGAALMLQKAQLRDLRKAPLEPLNPTADDF